MKKEMVVIIDEQRRPLTLSHTGILLAERLNKLYKSKKVVCVHCGAYFNLMKNLELHIRAKHKFKSSGARYHKFRIGQRGYINWKQEIIARRLEKYLVGGLV